MDQSKAAGIDIQPQRYEDFEPFCKWHTPENIFEVHLQGFRKEHLSVRTNQLGMLTIHGERPLDQTKSTWSRFQKEIKLPKNCDANRVAAKFVGGLLTLLDEEVKPAAGSCEFRPRCSASNARFKLGKYHIAVKLVLVVAVVVAFSFGAYVKYKHDHYSY